jgi:hypothetical protein
MANTGATGISQAGMAQAEPAPECEKLSNKNEECREELKGETADKTLVGPNGNGKGTTVSSCQLKTGGRPLVRSAHNNQKAQEKCPSSFVEGGEENVRRGKQSTLCGNYKHPAPAMQKSGHAEARLLDTLGGGKPGQLTFNIDWKKRRGRPSKMPCRTCHQMMCAAEECGFEIYLCDNNKQKHRVPCPANKRNRQSLKKTLDRR